MDFVLSGDATDARHYPQRRGPTAELILYQGDFAASSDEQWAQSHRGGTPPARDSAVIRTDALR